MENDLYISGKFIFNGVPLEDGPSWGMSLLKAGSMRFRWNEINANRISFLNNLCDGDKGVAAPELTHSKIVYEAKFVDDLDKKLGDGVVTLNKSLIPCVTVADCMPIFLFDVKTKAFGTLHSGWKGTGIVENAIHLMEERFGTSRSDVCVVMGPHIHDCCYKVDEERACYFTENFGSDCVVREENKYALSLAEANHEILRRLGIPENNILISSDCTCCNSKFGSFRRENPIKGTFTVQIAWNKW